MKDEFVTIVQKAIAVDRLVVPDGEIARETGGDAGRLAVDRDRFDPVDDVLQPQVGPRGLHDVERRPGIARLCADVQKQRAIRAQHARGGGNPGVRPVEVVGARQRVLVPVIADAEIVRRRRDDHVDAVRVELREEIEAVGEVEAAAGRGGFADRVRLQKD